MKIALLEPLGVKEDMINELAAPIMEKGHEFVYYPQKATDISELISRSSGCDAVIIANNPYPAGVINSLPQLKLIDVAFTGIDHVATEACKKNGITVCNAANYSNQTVAELVIGFTIALLRKMKACDTVIRENGTSAGLMGSEIAGKTVGIVGTGRIGMITAKLFLAFGARVIAYSRTFRPEATALGIEYVPLEQLMSDSDIISIHTPNNASTRNLICQEMIALMKPSAIFINCARGPIIDDDALAHALNEGLIAGAGIDVFDMEPPLDTDQPLLHAKNCLLAPHVGFLSEESMLRRARIVFRNLNSWLEGSPENICEQ